MKKVALVESAHTEPIAELLTKAGFELVDTAPELVVSHGGDGTILHSEFLWPGVPKVILRGSTICKMCSKLTNEEIIKRVAAGNYQVQEFLKLEVEARGQKLVALNDVVVHNQNPQHAIRYHLSLDNEAIGNEIIGDGIVVATPFGSTGYYRSITDSIFELGIGLAFNNSTEQADHMVINDDRVITMVVNRGEAVIYADNQAGHIKLEAGDKVVIKKLAHPARLIVIE